MRTSLQAREIDTASTIERGALRILSSDAPYDVRGQFDPEETLTVFSNAIEQALTDGFSGFRAAANMSWALDLEDGPERLITYEALLRSLFASARATGLCLYDRHRMPLDVIDGALSTHPVVCMHGGYSRNAFYDPRVRSLRRVDPTSVTSKLTRLDPRSRDAHRQSPTGRQKDRGSR